ncbi:MAG: hypothetical protein EOP84_17055 [Verrucomicrobiaceae bacterium]|nr:MAG: hypothetical protein EOP84_17055 [Verrucomicrobiaceae bacterium]
MVQVVLDNGVKGCELIPLKGTPWFVLNPTEFVAINPALFENSEICSDCKRPRYNCGIITRASLNFPPKLMTIFATDVLFENLISGMRGLLATADVVGCFKAAKVRGLEYLAPR